MDPQSDERPPEESGNGEQPGDLDALREESETVDRLRMGMQDRDAAGDGEGVAGEEADEDGRGRREQKAARRKPRQRHRERRQQHGRPEEAEPGACALFEVLGHDRAVDAGADRAGKHDGVRAELGEDGHSTTASLRITYGICASLCDCMSEAWCPAAASSYVRNFT
jgi:hypothetical protein